MALSGVRRRVNKHAFVVCDLRQIGGWMPPLRPHTQGFVISPPCHSIAHADNADNVYRYHRYAAHRHQICRTDDRWCRDKCRAQSRQKSSAMQIHFVILELVAAERKRGQGNRKSSAARALGGTPAHKKMFHVKHRKLDGSRKPLKILSH